jgi:hypothetical protein
MTAAIAEREIAPTLRLPPYGRKILALRAKGLAPAYALLIVKGWAPLSGPNLEQYVQWVIVVPDDEPAFGLDFRMVAALHVLVMAPTLPDVAEITAHVHRFAPASIWGWAEDGRFLLPYTRGLHAR